MFYTCGPNRALIKSGAMVGKPKIVSGGFMFALPCVQQVQLLDLRVMTLDIHSPHVYTKQGVPITVRSIAQVKISRYGGAHTPPAHAWPGAVTLTAQRCGVANGAAVQCPGGAGNRCGTVLGYDARASGARGGRDAGGPSARHPRHVDGGGDLPGP